MSEPTYAELLSAFEAMENVKSRPLCVYVGPTDRETAPLVKAYLYTSEQNSPLKWSCKLGPAGALCNIGYKYSGFDRRTTAFEVSTVGKNIKFGSGSDTEWRCTDITLSPPNIGRQEEYYCVALRKGIRPSPDASPGDTGNLTCSTEVPVGVGSIRLELSAQVDIC